MVREKRCVWSRLDKDTLYSAPEHKSDSDPTAVLRLPVTHLILKLILSKYTIDVIALCYIPPAAVIKKEVVVTCGGSGFPNGGGLSYGPLR